MAAGNGGAVDPKCAVEIVSRGSEVTFCRLSKAAAADAPSSSNIMQLFNKSSIVAVRRPPFFSYSSYSAAFHVNSAYLISIDPLSETPFWSLGRAHYIKKLYKMGFKMLAKYAAHDMMQEEEEEGIIPTFCGSLQGASITHFCTILHLHAK
jgi:hypothetical protein